MQNVIDKIELMFAALGGFLGWFFGGFDGYTGSGIFTIVEEAEGKGATRWGLLKSYQSNRSGWISLDYATKQ